MITTPTLSGRRGEAPKWFNRIETWEVMADRLGPLRFDSFHPALVERTLSDIRASGRPLYSAAYIVPPVPGERGPKHVGHLALTIRMLDAGITDAIVSAGSLEGVYHWLRTWPGVGDFLAYQMAIDLNYSAVIDYDEDEFVVPGPGAIDGVAKAWPGSSPRDAARLIHITKDEQDEQFARIGVQFAGLFGRPLKLIDCQNLYCELSKYARVAHPDVVGRSGRTRIKQAYRAWPPPSALAEAVLPAQVGAACSGGGGPWGRYAEP